MLSAPFWTLAGGLMAMVRCDSDYRDRDRRLRRDLGMTGRPSGSEGCHGQSGYPSRSTKRASRLDDVVPDLAQHLAYVAKRIPGPAEQPWSLVDIHRGVVRYPDDRELELTDLIGDGAERLEVDLAPCGGSDVGGYRHGVSGWFEWYTNALDVRSHLGHSVAQHHVRSLRRLP